MNFEILVAFILSLVIAIIHYSSERIKHQERPGQYRFISFAAGISIGYLFLDLLPQTYEASGHIKNWIYIYLLIGFAAVHLVEKYFYQHAPNIRLRNRLRSVHSASFFLYYFLVGCVLVDIIQESTVDGILFFFPVALHASLSTVSLSRIHGELEISLLGRAMSSLSAPLGVLFAFLLPVPQTIHSIFISGITGILLYVFVKELLPSREQGQPAYFVLGLVLFSILLGLVRLLFH